MKAPLREGAPVCASDDAETPVIDRLGEEFLAYVQDGMMIEVSEDGALTVDG